MTLLFLASTARAQLPPPVDDHHIAYHEIDVDQGVATLLESPCGTVMIDAGGRQGAGDARLLAYLDATERIDKAIYATAWDGDVVITADADGNYEVATSKHDTLAGPDVNVPEEQKPETC